MGFLTTFKTLFCRKTTAVSGLEDLPEYERYVNCYSSTHNPPTLMAIPYGKQYRHVCTSCGCETVVRAPQLRIKT